MSQEQISEAGLGKALGAAAALGGGALLANKAGSFLKRNPQAAGALASGAGAAAKGLISLIAPIVKEVGPAVAKSILKQKYGIDIPDSTIQKAASAPTVSTSMGSQGLAVAGQQQPQQQPPVINKSPEATTTTTATTTTPSTTPTKTISSDLISKLQNDPDVKGLMYLNKPDTDPDVVSKKTSIAKKYGINPDDVKSYLKQINPESVYKKGMLLNEFIPAAIAAGRTLAPMVAKHVALQVGTDMASKAIIKKLQQKKDNKDINNNEMEESKKKKVIAKEGIGTGTLGAVAGGMLGGPAGAVIGGLTGAAAPKAVKEIKSAVSSENEEDKKKKKKKVKESYDISKLVSLISQKNYAEADKYLKNVVDSKIKDRIESASNINIF
jgi:outer membrane lipoprotein SlyB